MNIFRLIGELVVVYILYKVIFDFIVPLYQASKQMKGKMSEMQDRMKQQQRTQAEADRKYEQERAAKQTKISSEDYIDYEEVKN